jgi:hypothetical protein
MINFASAKRKSVQVHAFSKYCNAEAISAMLHSYIWIAYSMTGKETGFVMLFTKHISYSMVLFHCIARQEALCAKCGTSHMGRYYENCHQSG